MEPNKEDYALCLANLGGGLYCCGDIRSDDDKHHPWCPQYRRPSGNRS